MLHACISYFLKHGHYVLFVIFSFWAKFNRSFSYTSLQGEPIIGANRLPVTYDSHGDFHVDRVAGDVFNYAIIYSFPGFDLRYTILFDWDAIIQHEPLWQVESLIQGAANPILNHHYFGM